MQSPYLFTKALKLFFFEVSKQVEVSEMALCLEKICELFRRDFQA
jgi:hypothetical protein